MIHFRKNWEYFLSPKLFSIEDLKPYCALFAFFLNILLDISHPERHSCKQFTISE